MNKSIVVTDYYFDNFNMICEYKPAPDVKPVGAYLSNVKNLTKYDRIELSDVSAGIGRFCVEVDDEEFECGTWKLIFVLNDGEECPASYNDEVNPYKSTRMIELSEDKHLFEPVKRIHYFGAIDEESCFVIRKWYNKIRLIRKDSVIVRDFEDDELNVGFDIKFLSKENVRQAEIWLWSMGLKKFKRIPVPLDEVRKKYVSLDLEPCIELFNKNEAGKLWRVFLVYNSRGLLHISRLEMREFEQADKKSVYYSDFDEEDRYVITYPVRKPGKKGYKWVFQMYFNNHSELCAKFVPRD